MLNFYDIKGHKIHKWYLSLNSVYILSLFLSCYVLHRFVSLRIITNTKAAQIQLEKKKISFNNFVICILVDVNEENLCLQPCSTEDWLCTRVLLLLWHREGSVSLQLSFLTSGLSHP